MKPYFIRTTNTKKAQKLPLESTLGKRLCWTPPKKPKKIQEDNTTFDTLQDSELHAAEHNPKKSDPFTFRGKKPGPSTQQTGSEMSILGDNGGKKVCKSCKRLVGSPDVETGQCGHDVHIGCSKRIDAQPHCGFCPSIR
mmetsp:Transcript_5002/g.7537  ORF Transcript_5002/g.7537 Transcript_5002/m.7537 type:complete len:139 (-) Transcript_5002:83-499(-)